MNKIKEGNSFLFSALGAATGLGNAVRFPSLCAYYGGAFAFAYVASLALVCYPLLCAELSLGRYGNPFAQTVKTLRPRFGWVAYAAVFNSALIALYYGVTVADLGSALLTYAAVGVPQKAEGAWVFAMAALSFGAIRWVLKGGDKRLSRTGKVSVVSSLSLFACLAAISLAEGRGVSAVFAFRPSDLACGALWADALGQSVLALSLAAGVMPTFARSQVGRFNAASAAAKIIAANLVGCLLAALAVLPSCAGSPVEGGTAAALSLYPRVLNALFARAAVRRAFGTAFYASLWTVAVQSACSLLAPLLSLTGENRRALTAVCLLGFALYPLFAADGREVMLAVDRTACSVNAALIAFAECLLFRSPADMPRLTRFTARPVCLLLRLFCPLACGACALLSVCSARFSCFSPLAKACAFVAFGAVFVAAAARSSRGLKQIRRKSADFVKSHIIL